MQATQLKVWSAIVFLVIFLVMAVMADDIVKRELFAVFAIMMGANVFRVISGKGSRDEQAG